MNELPTIHKVSFFVLIAVFSCKEQYLPPVLKTNKNYLVVEGSIITGDSTIIKLSRTSNISDTALPQPEAGDQVTIEGRDGSMYPLTGLGNGSYYSLPLSLDASQQYRHDILAANGGKYQSDFVPVQITPPVDSVGWYQDSASNVNIWVSTHDASHAVGYYRWDYLETWQYQSNFKSIFDWVNGAVVIVNPNGFIYDCWSSAPSASVVVASSAKLAQNVIYQQPVAFVPVGSEKMAVKYSILVKQYSLTQDAYNFWQNLKTATQQLGSLFDAQPAQLQSNIHSVTNPGEVVVGYVSASSVQTKRLFIDGLGFRWGYVPYYNYLLCGTIAVRPDSMNYYFPTTGAHNWVVEGTMPFSPNFILDPADCGDCRVHGGTNVKPAYWP